MPNKIRNQLIFKVGQRKQIIKFRYENPNISIRKIATFFAEKWQKMSIECHV